MIENALSRLSLGGAIHDDGDWFFLRAMRVFECVFYKCDDLFVLMRKKVAFCFAWLKIVRACELEATRVHMCADTSNE